MAGHVYCENSELEVCDVCRLYEGSLTTDCCGENVASDKVDDIYDGKLDYRKNVGWVRGMNPTNQAMLYSNIFNFVTKRTNKFRHENELVLRFGIDKEQHRRVKKKVMEDLYMKG